MQKAGIAQAASRPHRVNDNAGPAFARSSSHRILIVGDTPDGARAASEALTRAGYEQVRATAGLDDALDTIVEFDPDVVLLDVASLDPNTIGRVEAIRGSAGTTRPVAFLARDPSAAATLAAIDAGAADVISTPVDSTELFLRVRTLLHVRRLEMLVMEQKDAEAGARIAHLEQLATAAEARDDLTGDHPQRVGRLAAELARLIGLPAEQVELIRRAAPVHDIGKVAIPDAVLHKAGELSADETAVMRTHTTIGGYMLAGSEHSLIRTAERIAVTHHERWDGLGYPNKISGDAIPIEGRITAVADFFDALTHDRPYRLAVPREFVLLDIMRGAGTQFDPDVAAAMRTAASAVDVATRRG